MKKYTKIIAIFIVLVMLAGIFGSLASAQTLQQKDAETKAKYNQAKQVYMNEVNAYKTAKQSFLNAKGKYQQLKNADNKAAYEEQAKSFLTKSIAVAISYLETARNKVQYVRGISETERSAILADIDQDIIWLKERQNRVQTATATQIQEEAKAVRDYWLEIRVSVKRYVGEIFSARINFLITKAKTFGTKIDAKIDELKAAGKDTTQLESWLTQFNQNIAKAEEKYNAAKAKFQAITTKANADSLFKEGHVFIIDANKYIKDAHAQLVLIVKEMKKMGANIPATPTSTPATSTPPTSTSTTSTVQ